MCFLNKYIFSPVSIKLFTVGINFFSNVLINRYLGLALKGQYTLILNYANFLQLFLNLGICYAYPMLINKEGEDSKKTVVTIIWLQTIVFIFCSIIALLISPNITMLMIVLLSTVMICNSQITFLALIDDIKRRNFVILSSSVLFLICNFICYFVAPGFIYVTVLLLFFRCLYEIIVLTKNNKYAFFSFHYIDKKRIISTLKVGLPTSVLAILISCNYNIDIFLLDWMNCGDTQIGIYGVAFSLSNMLWIVPDAFKELIYHKSTREDNYNFVMKCIFANMLLCFVITFAFCFLGKWFLGIVYGQEYTVAFDVSLVLFCGVIPMVAFKLIHPIYVNKGRASVVLILLFIAVVSNIASSLFLIPRYGSLGAAAASVISYTICGILFYLKFKKDYCRCI